MDIAVYMRSLETSLSARQGVTQVERADFEHLSGDRAKIAVRLRFFDHSFVDLYELVDTARSFPQHLRYSYQYVKGTHSVFRYDNSRHHPEISTFPHHKHVGSNGDIEPSQRPSLADVFREIKRHLRRFL
jgi:hypothetical protein